MTDTVDAEELADDFIDTDYIQATEVLGAMSDQVGLAEDLELIVERAMGDSASLLDRMKLLARNLGAYFDDDDTTATYVLLAIALGADNEGSSLLADVKSDEARQALEGTFRRLRGLYSDEISRGLQLATRPAEDWQYVNVSTKYGVDNGRWDIDVDMQRFDGDRARVVGDPLSMLRLINHLLGAINEVGDITEDYPSILDDPEDVELFTQHAATLFEGIQAGPADDAE